MAFKENVIKTVIGAAVGGGLSYVAKNPEVLRGTVIEAVRFGIDYENKKKSGELADLTFRIPGRWNIAEVIARILAQPGASWRDISRGNPLPGGICLVEQMQADSSMEGLTLQRIHFIPSGKNVRNFTIARSTIDLVGSNHLMNRLPSLPRSNRES